MSAGREQVEIEIYRKECRDQVYRIYRFERWMEALAPLFAMSAKQRDWVLRHHAVADVTSASEISTRQSLDALLHMCGVLNAGWCAGALSEIDLQRIPRELWKLLKLREVKDYYSKRYPLAYMPDFLARAGSNITRSGQFAPSWFASLLRLDANFRDPRLTEFLLVVDGYWLDNDTVNFPSLVAAVADPGKIIDAVTTPRDQRSCLQSVICGLERFLTFCEDLQDIIEAAPNRETMQRSAFQLYQYWFTVRDEELLTVITKALDTLKSTARADLAEIRTTRESVDRLLRRARTASQEH
ncbi:hypothetical protein FHT80_002077 [Rhizobium sp. BK226]|uniref:hypothetical protein n=1 Tax=Rhizobium sp. BK226 TaxID=2587075 RepID=UPI001607171E|nr:hypothetical protein [Rhizobium sp. BK226]MBB4112758.1 hypothetical protein [Rhizobium sp. BK226]